MTAHGGKGVPFLLPALLQVLDGSDTEGQAAWLTALLQNQVLRPTIADLASSNPLLDLILQTADAVHLTLALEQREAWIESMKSSLSHHNAPRD